MKKRLAYTAAVMVVVVSACGGGASNDMGIARETISVGDLHSIALKNDGTVLTWGNNSDGQLGDNTTINRSNAVSATTNAMAVAAGAYHSLSLRKDGVVAVATSYHSLALKKDGSLVAWGNNGNGQLGNGTTTVNTVPSLTLGSNRIALP